MTTRHRHAASAACHPEIVFPSESGPTVDFSSAGSAPATQSRHRASAAKAKDRLDVADSLIVRTFATVTFAAGVFALAYAAIESVVVL